MHSEVALEEWLHPLRKLMSSEKSGETILTTVADGAAELFWDRNIKPFPMGLNERALPQGLAGSFDAADGYHVAMLEDRSKRVTQR